MNKKIEKKTKKHLANDNLIMKRDYFIILYVIILITLLTLTMMELPYFAIISNISTNENNDIVTENNIDKVQIPIYNSDKQHIIITGTSKDIDDDIIKKSIAKSSVPNIERETFELVKDDEWEKADIIFIDGNDLGDIGSIKYLMSKVKGDATMVFTSIPDERYFDMVLFKELAGIKSIKPVVIQESLTFTSNFLLGGLLDMPDYKYNAHTIKLLATTKKYALNTENQSPVVWRNTYNSNEVYVVNGEFCTTSNGLGILSSIVSEIKIDYIYPVVNSCVLSYTHFPYISYENSDYLLEHYNRDAMGLQMDILLPDIISINKSRMRLPSSFMSYGLRESNKNYEDIASNIKQMKYIMKDFNELGGEIEMKYSGDLSGDTAIASALFDKDRITALYLDEQNMSQLDALISNQNETLFDSLYYTRENPSTGFEYISDDIVYIPFTMEDAKLTDQTKLDIATDVTMYGAIIHNLDFMQVIYPKDLDRRWKKIIKDYSTIVDFSNLKYNYIRNRNIVETTYDVQKYANNYADVYYYDDNITLLFDNYMGECYYILRTDKTVVNIDGGVATQIEENAYMITVNSKEIKIEID